jgi:Tfp pilus assembly protein PilF
VVGLLRRLAVACFNRFHFFHAHLAFTIIRQLAPDDRGAAFGLVSLYTELAQLNDAIVVLEDWLSAFPDDIEARAMVARLYAQMAEPERATEHLAIAAQKAPASADVLLTTGLFHRWNGELAEASQSFRAALKNGENFAVLCGIADNLIDQGEQDEAIHLLERARQLAPEQPLPYALLARSRYYRDAGHPHIAFLKNRLKTGNLPPFARLGFHFTLGEVFDKLELWDEAFAHFRAGNDLNRKKFSFAIEEATTYVDREIQAFDPKYVAAASEFVPAGTGAGLIFVVGIPRSGTTLIEQILASHPDVRAGGERNDVAKIAMNLCAQQPEPYPAGIRHLDREAIVAGARQHLENVSRLARGAAHFVDKQPGNFFKIGLIHMLFPGAKIVHCRRSALDTCFSCYCKNLLNVLYSHDLTTLGLFYREYERMMAHWHSVLPGRILDVQYEDLVRDPEPQIRRLIAYCELPWHDACLKPHETKRVVQTASATQVKQPIHTGSIGRWKHYEKHLQPLFDALGPNAVR